ncbi:MAG: hypothetical protein O3A59_14875 [Nitrospirae bacterium]|nr:hypothetical protein [Nitrospirota bacterium]
MNSSLLIFSLCGCSSFAPKDDNLFAQAPLSPEVSDAIPQSCIGTTQVPVELVGQFEAVDDEALLHLALGEPTKGKLCQGQVYLSKDRSHITIYRAWNSTNPNSAMGQWWAFNQPVGKVSRYRADYEICYEWSPLDTLTRCTLRPGTKVVIGTGQSAECSEHLTYPISAEPQMYIVDASTVVSDCTTYDSEFSWN